MNQNIFFASFSILLLLLLLGLFIYGVILSYAYIKNSLNESLKNKSKNLDNAEEPEDANLEFLDDEEDELNNNTERKND